MRDGRWEEGEERMDGGRIREGMIEREGGKKEAGRIGWMEGGREIDWTAVC